MTWYAYEDEWWVEEQLEDRYIPEFPISPSQ